MALHRKRKVSLRDAGTIVGHLDQAPACLLNSHGDVMPAGVQGILHQLFNHRGGPLDHLTGGDLGGNIGGKNANGHGFIITRDTRYNHAVQFSTVFFDLDDTLYPSASGLWEAIRQRIGVYMHDFVGLSWEEIPELRRKYFEQYGTALRGLEANYPVRREEYLAFVHDLPLKDYIRPDPSLKSALEGLSARKLIFTNADSAHARRVLNALEVADFFDGIVDINAIEPYCKPMPGSFQCALHRAEESDPGRCVLIDDMLRNTSGAQAIGMRSILFGTESVQPGADAALKDWTDLPGVLKELEAG